MWKTLFDIFVAFFKSSILSYGGGPASIPLMQKEVVNNYKWFTNEQFADALAVGNTLPGPIAPKMAAYVGYNVSGIAGAVIGVLAVVVPTAVAIIILAKFLLINKNSPHIIGMLKVAKPMVVVFLLQTTLEFLTKKNYPNVSAYLVSIIAFALVYFLKVNPGIVMFGGLLTGFFFYKLF